MKAFRDRDDGVFALTAGKLRSQTGSCRSSRFVAAPMSGRLPGPPRYRSGALVKGELLAAIATVAFKSLSASEVLSNPFRLYVYAFDWASNRVAGRAL